MKSRFTGFCFFGLGQILLTSILYFYVILMPMEKVNLENEIRLLIDKESQAWDNKDVKSLLSIFHPDMVWPWPLTAQDHDPLQWTLVQGRYNYERWKTNWQTLFDTHDLIHNVREIKKIVISAEGDGAFAVVDIDTLWRDHAGRDNHWQGRTCKIYTKTAAGWKMISQVGALDYHQKQF